jgi:hypothetical protein
MNITRHIQCADENRAIRGVITHAVNERIHGRHTLTMNVLQSRSLNNQVLITFMLEAHSLLHKNRVLP